MLEQPSNFVPQGRLKELKGDLSIPESAGNRFILIPVADDNSTKGGTVFARWTQAASTYNQWYRMSYGKMGEWLGQIKTAQVQSDTVVAALLCQKGADIDYVAFEKCIDSVGKEAANNSGSIHMEKIGDWDKVKKIVEEKLLKRGLNVNVYTK